MEENREREPLKEEMESPRTYYTDMPKEEASDPLDREEKTERKASISAEPDQSVSDEAEKRHNYELTAMILGILSLALLFCCGLGVILGIISIVFACKAKGLSPNKKMEGMALAGLICSIISFSIALFYLLIIGFAALIAILATV